MLRRPLSLFGLILLFCLSVLLFIGTPIPAISAAFPEKLTQRPSKPVRQNGALTQDVLKTVLSNGLTILTKEVKTAPVVTVQVWYRVGSRDESPGISGIAHQLEHLVFKGTKERPIQFGRLFSALGSQSNAFTSYDMTAYFGSVERDKLDALLTLEADRMQHSLIDEKQLTSEKRVVISELQGYENSPNYRLSRTVMKAAFPDSPYGLPVGGTKTDVQKFTVQQVQAYYRQFYRPDNATLIVVGDFNTETTLQKIKETFGTLVKPDVALPTTQIAQSAKVAVKQPIVLREPGSAALLNEVYPLPPAGDRDVPALQVMDYILTGGRSSQLYQALLETGLASSAEGSAANLISGGWYEFDVTAAPGKQLSEIEPALQQVVANLQTQGVTAEALERAKTQLRAELILRNRDITSQAFQLGDDQLTTGDYQFTDKLLGAIARVTAADVQRVAKTYLAAANRTVGFFEPTTPDGKPGTSSGNFSQTTENFSPGAPVDPAEVAKYLPPVAGNQPPTAAQSLPQRIDFSNGMQLFLLPDTSTPTVTLSGFVSAGTAFDKPPTAGLASLTAENLLNGTSTQDALAIAKTLENRGASLDFGANREGVQIAGEALTADLPVLTQVLADVLRTANFPADELELSRQRALTSLKLELDNPGRLARRIFQQTVYPENHPFHTFPTEASLQRITRAEMIAFYQTHYRPEATVLALVGDFDPANVVGLINQQFGAWSVAAPAPTVVFPQVSRPAKITRVMPALPGKTQSITLMGYSAIDRRDPRFYAALVLNQILGGDTLSSRLGTEIRDRQGLTYGIYSFFAAGKQPGPFLISMQTAPEDANKAINSTLALLKQMREKGVSATEVAAAVRSLTSSYPVELADPNSLAVRILMNAVYGLNINELRQYNAKLAAVTPAQVNRVIQELLYPDQMVIVTAGPPLV